MLHRSFKPAKCKTALKLAVSRIKLLRNKREAQVRQLKRELAQLLQSGQDQTARIRVEHVMREEKTMAAYDLVEIYCELIAARLPMIESQKNCPIDLKEAVSSVIFASPRCSDLPELADVKKHFTSKYGKEFASAAIELRPDCGVNRMLVEKLSVKAPDGPTKIKILAAIAKEHNINWEPKSFEDDVKSSQDKLVGPSTFEKVDHVEPSQLHVPPVHDDKSPPNLHTSSQLKPMHQHDDKGPPNLHASLQLKPMHQHDTSSNSYEQNASAATTRKAGGNQSTSGVSNQDVRSSGTGSQEMDFRDPYSEHRSSNPMGRQNWNMEFKDAASAAHAAAESAERASIAARAAAEFSNRENMTRQYSSGSHSSGSVLRDEVSMAARAAAELSNHKNMTSQYSSGLHSPSGSGLRDDVPQKYPYHDQQHLSTGSIHSSFHRSSSGVKNENNTATEQDNLVGMPNEYYRNSQENLVKHVQPASSMSDSVFGDDRPFIEGSQMADEFQHIYSFEEENSELHEMDIKKQASRTEEDFATKLHGDLNTSDNDHFGYATTDGQYTNASYSHFSTPSDDHSDNLNLDGWKMGNETKEDLFVTDEGNTQRNAMEKSSYNDTSVVFDDYRSDGDDYEFDVDVDKKYKGEGSRLFSSPGSKSQLDPLENTKSWSHGQNVDEKETSSSSPSHFSVVSERLTKSAVSSEKEDLMPVTFDDSDDAGSDNEVDLVMPKFPGTFDYENSALDQFADHEALGSSSRNDKNVSTDSKSWLSPSSAASNNVEELSDKKVNITAVSEKNFGYDDLPVSQPSPKGRNSLSGLDRKANAHASQSLGTSNDTKFFEESHFESGKELSYGTLKGGRRNKGYRQPPYMNTLDDVSSSLGDMSFQNERTLPTGKTSTSFDAPVQDKYARNVNRENRSVGLRRHDTSSDSGTHKLHIQNEQRGANRKPSSRASVNYFISDDSDSEDELPKQNIPTLARPISGRSRRTPASSKNGTGSGSRDAPLSEAYATPGSSLGWKSSRVSYDSKDQKASSVMKNSGNLTGSKLGSAENEVSKPISEPHRSLDEKTIKSSSPRVQPSSSLSKTVNQNSGEASKSLNSDGDTSSKQKPDHVHPKLPDYDSFAAHFLSLKKDRQ